MQTRLFLLLTFFSCNALLQAQSNSLERPVTFNYYEMRLEDALADLTRSYAINFSYSADFIPVDKRVTARVKNKPLGKALDKLFAKTPVIYRPIGNQIALSVDPNKAKPRLSSTKSKKKGKETSIVVEVPEKKPEIPQAIVPKVDTTLLVELDTIQKEPDLDIEDAVPFQDGMLTPEEVWARLQRKNDLGNDRKAAQFSLLPKMGTNMEDAAKTTNHLSLNLLWGENGGVQGFEAGTLVNKVTNNVEGMQVAGLGNNVGKDVTGMQIAGLYNHNQGRTKGMQISSVFNYTDNGDAGQFAGLANIVENDFKGMQLSGIFNKAGADSDGVQAAGMFNVTEGTAKMQIGGIFNKAKKVEGAQIGGLLNVAQDVKGFQIAFINVSDTVSGVPIGLINIIKKGGYNRFEVSGGEMLHFNLQWKLGSPKFYNVFHAGTRIPELGTYVWGLGYGIGYRIQKTEKHSMNYEAMAMQINENEPWTNTLNMVGKMRFLAAWKLGRKRTEFFIGPTINLMISELRNRETGEFGSTIMPYHIFSFTNTKDRNFKGWIGLNGGFRF